MSTQSITSGFKLQVWEISHEKTISRDRHLVDDECLIMASNEEGAIREAKRRIRKYANNIRFHLWYPDGTTVHFLSTESRGVFKP